MSYTPIYERNNYVNGIAPAINATHLNQIEDALVSLGNNAQTDSSRIDSMATSKQNKLSFTDDGNGNLTLGVVNNG